MVKQFRMAFRPSSLMVTVKKKRARKKNVQKACERCGTPFETDSKKQRFCSPQCSAIASQRANRPSKQVLAKEIAASSYEALGRKYEVNPATIKRWAIKYGLI